METAMISKFALGMLLALSLVVQPTAQRGRRAEPVPTASDNPLTECWWPADEIPANDRVACEQHRNYVLRAWRDHSSYYALLEIAENLLGPPQDDSGAVREGSLGLRREEVIDLLGVEHIDWDYPNSRRDGFLVWGSDRSLVGGSYLVVQFDKSGLAQSYYWVSE
jgi:hypothetical protein